MGINKDQVEGRVKEAAGKVQEVAGKAVGSGTQQVKGAVCGNGRADKGQVMRMVKTLLGLEHDPHPDHAADALAVAICHVNCAPLSHALAKASA